MNLIDLAKTRLDSWMNVVTGLGVANDKTRATSYALPTGITEIQLETLYDSDWLASRIIDSLPVHAFRKGFACDDPQALERFNVINYSERYPKGILQGALKMGRLYGGSALLLGARSNARLEEPLPKGAELAWLDLVKRRHLVAVELDGDPNSETFGEALVCRIVGDHPRTGNLVHRSRLILCEGREIATRGEYPWITELGTWRGFPTWGSVLQPVYEEMSRFGMSWTAVSHMLQEASIAVMKMSGVIEMLAQEDQEAINNRLALLSASRSVAKTILLDAENSEEYTREAVSFTDLPALMSLLCNNIAGAADIPATVLFKQAPQGMNATGESDLTQWYDSVREYQTTSVAPKLQRILSMLAGKAVAVTFESLWEPTEKERQETRLAQASADRVYYDLGVVTEGELRRKRGADGTLGFEIEEEELELEEPEAVPEASNIQLAPTDLAKVLTVNEMRAVAGFGRLASAGADADLTLTEFEAKKVATGEIEGAADAKGAPAPAPAREPAPVEPEENEPEE